MSIHFVKLIELLSIDQVQDKKFLHIVVYANEAFERYWEVDLETATNLQRICEFTGTHKYRLSLRAVSDSSNNPQITSHITKTYLNKSTRTDFFATEAYRQQVELIRQSGSVAKIQQLPFLFTPEELIELKERTDELFVIDEEIPPTDITLKFPNTEPPETIVITKEELTILKSPLHKEDTLVATIPAEEALSEFTKSEPSTATTKAEPNALVIHEDASPKMLSPLRLLLKKLLALFSVLALVILSTYFLMGQFSPKEKLLSESTTYETYKIEEPFIFKLPANHVALTFDKGPSIYTQDIMDILKKYDIGATFFILGSNLNTFPLTVERMYKDGYAIGHATTNYSLLTDMSYDKVEAEWLYTTNKIEAITGGKVELFRPPYGLFNKNTLAVAEEYDFHLITWSSTPLESKATIDSYLQSHELSGAIISMTESQETVDALPAIIDTLLANELKIVQLQ